MPRSDKTPSTPATAARRDLPWLLLAMFFPAGITYVYFVLLANQPSGVQQLAGGALKALQFALPALVIFGVCREPVRFLRPTIDGLFPALVFGGLVAAAMIAWHRPLLGALGVLQQAESAVQQKVTELGFVSPAKFLGLAAFYTLAHSLLEEYYWRWFVFGRLRNYMAIRSAIVISSVGFMLHHIIVLARFFGWLSPATWLCSLGVGVGGAVWAWMFNKYGKLFPTWVSHALVDAAIFLVGYRFLFS